MPVVELSWDSLPLTVNWPALTEMPVELLYASLPVTVAVDVPYT